MDSPDMMRVSQGDYRDESGRTADDRMIRETLISTLSAEANAAEHTVLIHELGLLGGAGRIDVARVTDSSLDGYEIKSDRDDWSQLGRQIRIYNQVLDRITLVTGSRLAPEARERIPHWWGIRRWSGTSETNELATLRKARANPEINARAIAELLWHEDATAILNDHGLLDGVRGRPRRILWDKLALHLSADRIRAAVRKALRNRRYPYASGRTRQVNVPANLH